MKSVPCNVTLIAFSMFPMNHLKAPSKCRLYAFVHVGFGGQEYSTWWQTNMQGKNHEEQSFLKITNTWRGF